jgi:hypothetical protein
MSADRERVTVLVRAMTTLNAASPLLVAQGEAAAFLQAFDPAPEDDTLEADTSRERLDSDQARDAIRERLRAGFVGLSSFSCVELHRLRLYVEVFDSRQPEAGSNAFMSIAVSAPLKKAWTGKYRLAGTNAEILGEADPLD